MAYEAVTIRLAEPKDLKRVRRLLVETWHDTYDALIGAEKVTEITDSWHSLENLAPQLTMPETSFLVAESDARIVGHAFANASRPPILMLSRLYVLPSSQRRGIGAQLIAEAMTRHPACGAIRLEVEADNAKGLAFYRRQGFRPVAEKTVEGIVHAVMERRLAAAS
jgi:ribosomal protein S18 acetylase RimI-like enzyme